MMKRILSLCLCLMMLVGILLAAGCGEAETPSDPGTLPATINMLGITGEETTPEAVRAVEEAINKITKNRFKTRVILTLVTADEYIELVEARVAVANKAKITKEAIGKYNALAVKEANRATKLLASQKKRTSKWTQEVRVEASTLGTGTEYTVEETTVFEDGRIETRYPDAKSPIDIIMIADREMYDYLDSKGYLLSIQKRVADATSTEFTKFRQYVYPTFFSQLIAVTGDFKAVPNNNILAEFTYLLVDKTIAEKYDFDIDAVKSYADLDSAAEGELGFLGKIKKNESVAPFASEPDALGIFSYFENDIPVGTYFHPIYGYNEQEGTDFKIRSLYSIPQYQDHVALMDTYRGKGYFAASEAEDAAVRVLKGDASVPTVYGDKYEVKVLQNPFVEPDVLFNGMMAVSSFSADEKRAIEIIEMFNTDPAAKNLLQYGIAYDGDNEAVANYRVNTVTRDDGTEAFAVERLNHNYMMNNSMTGNVYMGYPEEGQSIDAWTYYKQTNLASSLSPFLNFHVADKEFNDMLTSILHRAVLTEYGVTDYDAYQDSVGTTVGNEMRRNFKLTNKLYFIEKLEKAGATVQPVNLVQGKTVSPLAEDFKSFLLSREAQEIFVSEGFTTVNKNAPAYVKKEGLSGTLKLCALFSSFPAGYFDTAARRIYDAYLALNPAVVIEEPPKNPTGSYITPMSSVLDGTYDLGYINTELSAVEKSRGLSSTLFARSYLNIFNDDGNRTYNFTWYENQLVNDVVAQKYSKIVSAMGKELLITNKLGELAGINMNNYKDKKNETEVFNAVRKNADAYYNNIAYLRIMAEILLWNDLSESELDAYRSLSDTAFADAVFSYVRANYEKENNLTDEDYTELVKGFMTSVLEFTAADGSTYSVSWDDFQKTKSDAREYIDAAETIKAQYYDKLVKKLGAGYLSILTLPEVMDEVYNIMYDEYLAENGLNKKEFENRIKDMYLTKVGTTAEEFATFPKISDEYKNYLSKLRKTFKKVLVEEFSSEAYKKGETGITNTELLSALFSHFQEEELRIVDKMCAIADIDPADFAASKVHMENYAMYLKTMKTMYVYTLRTVYTQTQIDAWSYEEIETNLFNVLYETGFYTNEMAKYIGMSLGDYMSAKSSAVGYINVITTAVNALSSELKAKGYDPKTLAGEDRDIVEAACKEVIAEKYFADRVEIKDALTAISSDYVKGLAEAADKTAYLAEADKALREDSFFMAVVGALEASWKEEKAARAAEAAKAK